MVFRIVRVFVLVVLAMTARASAWAQDYSLKPHVIGSPSAPIVVDEYISMTCTHCAEFYATTWPEIEKRYVETGKVRFVVHDFPLSGLGLKAAAVAECMPTDSYFPFVKTIYSALIVGITDASEFETKVFQYAALGGLPTEKAKACSADTKLQDAIIADRSEALAKYNVEATPSFVINQGAQLVNGDPGVEGFSKTFDALLAAKKK